MNKAELVEALTGRLGDKKTAAAALDAVLEEIQRVVSKPGKDSKVSIAGFGVFEKRVRGARTARNPRTGEAVKVKKTTVPAFRAGQGFKDVVAGKKKIAAAPKKSAAKATAAKATATKATATKAAAKKTTKAAPARATKSAAKKTATKATAKKTAAKKTTAVKKTTAAKKTAVKKTVAKRAPARKTATKSTAKRTTARKR